MGSSHDAPIIHAFNLAQKRYFQPVNSQKPHAEWGSVDSLEHSDLQDRGEAGVEQGGEQRAH